jgi:hypothetical protein
MKLRKSLRRQPVLMTEYYEDFGKRLRAEVRVQIGAAIGTFVLDHGLLAILRGSSTRFRDSCTGSLTRSRIGRGEVGR